MIRRFDPSPARRSELHRQIEARCGLSEAAAMLLVELDVFGEVQIDHDEYLPVFAELRAKGLAELASEPHACTRVLPGVFVREVVERVRSIASLEAELARRDQRSAPPTSTPPPKETRPPAELRSNEPISAELERAIVEDALAVIDRSPWLPAASKARVYLRIGPRYVRVFWTYAGQSELTGSILHFVEKATGRVYSAKSARQIGRPTGRVISSSGGADA